MMHKPRNPNPRFRRIVRDGELRLRDFAYRYRLPTVVIEGLVRPVLASGLWNPIPFLLELLSAFSSGGVNAHEELVFLISVSK